MAMKIPCVPICGKLPEGMIAMSQAVVLDEDLNELDKKLAAVDFHDLVDQAGRLWVPPGEVADEPEERARMIEQHADNAFRAVGPGCVRGTGGLAFLSIPDERPDHPVRSARYGNHPKSAFT